MRSRTPSRTSRRHRNTSLAQTTVRPPTLRKLDSLAKSTGHSRASYLRHLIEVHVNALEPKLLLALERTRPTNVKP